MFHIENGSFLVLPPNTLSHLNTQTVCFLLRNRLSFFMALMFGLLGSQESFFSHQVDTQEQGTGNRAQEIQLLLLFWQYWRNQEIFGTIYWVFQPIGTTTCRFRLRQSRIQRSPSPPPHQRRSFIWGSLPGEKMEDIGSVKNLWLHQNNLIYQNL